MIVGIKSESPSTQKKAADKLAKMGKAAQPALPALLRGLQKPIQAEGRDLSDEIQARLAMADALEKIGAERKKIVAGLTRLLGNKLPGELRLQVIRKRIGSEEDATVVVAVLVRALQKQIKDSRPVSGTTYVASVGSTGNVFQEILIALGKQGRQAKTAVPFLVKAYQAVESNDDRILIVKTLAAIGPEAKGAIPLLNKAVQGDNAELRRAAARALGAITNPQKKDRK